MKPQKIRKCDAVHRPAKFILTAVCLAAIGSVTLNANAALDVIAQPPATDPSHFVDQPADPTQAQLDLLNAPEANEGSFEIPGGFVVDKRAIDINNVFQRDTLMSTNYPTNGLPSPLFNAKPFSQQMLMFEEFGPEALDPAATAGTLPFPRPKSGVAPFLDANPAQSGPDTTELDTFLAQTGISPFPQRESNTGLQNPWKPDIESFLGRFLTNPPAEGRPPGEGWAHQRWNEFFPQAFFKTVQTGSRPNGGIRD